MSFEHVRYEFEAYSSWLRGYSMLGNLYVNGWNLKTSYSCFLKVLRIGISDKGVKLTLGVVYSMLKSERIVLKLRIIGCLEN